MRADLHKAFHAKQTANQMGLVDWLERLDIILLILTGPIDFDLFK